jgi:hypothetical protein
MVLLCEDIAENSFLTCYFIYDTQLIDESERLDYNLIVTSNQSNLSALSYWSIRSSDLLFAMHSSSEAQTKAQISIRIKIYVCR